MEGSRAWKRSVRAGASVPDVRTAAHYPRDRAFAQVRLQPRGRRRRVTVDDGRRQTTWPILKIGRYIATTSPPMTTPRITMIIGSISEDRLSTASSTSRS